MLENSCDMHLSAQKQNVRWLRGYVGYGLRAAFEIVCVERFPKIHVARTISKFVRQFREHLEEFKQLGKLFCCCDTLTGGIAISKRLLFDNVVGAALDELQNLQGSLPAQQKFVHSAGACCPRWNCYVQ